MKISASGTRRDAKPTGEDDRSRTCSNPASTRVVSEGYVMGVCNLMLVPQRQTWSAIGSAAGDLARPGTAQLHGNGDGDGIESSSGVLAGDDGSHVDAIQSFRAAARCTPATGHESFPDPTDRGN